MITATLDIKKRCPLPDMTDKCLYCKNDADEAGYGVLCRKCTRIIYRREVKILSTVPSLSVGYKIKGESVVCQNDPCISLLAPETFTYAERFDILNRGEVGYYIKKDGKIQIYKYCPLCNKNQNFVHRLSECKRDYEQEVDAYEEEKKLVLIKEEEMLKCKDEYLELEDYFVKIQKAYKSAKEKYDDSHGKYLKAKLVMIKHKEARAKKFEIYENELMNVEDILKNKICAPKRVREEDPFTPSKKFRSEGPGRESKSDIDIDVFLRHARMSSEKSTYDKNTYD